MLPIKNIEGRKPRFTNTTAGKIAKKGLYIEKKVFNDAQ